MLRLRMMTVVLLLAVLAGTSPPAAAQVRYKDDEGVTHWVNSRDEVAPKYRPGATGTSQPETKPAAWNPSDPGYWDRKAKDADARREKEQRDADQAAALQRAAAVWERDVTDCVNTA